MRILSLVIFCLAAFPALADHFHTRLAAAVATDDPAVLEAEVRSALNDAEADADIDQVVAFWRDFYTTFGTTRPETLRLIGRWREEYPDSALAMTADAESRERLASLLRGGALAGDTNLPSLVAFGALYRRSADLAEAAIEADPHMLGAYFVLFNAHMTGHGSMPIRRLIDAAFDISPTSDTVDAAAAVFNPRWGGSVDQMLQVCADYAPRAKDYDAEACGINIAFDFPQDQVLVASARRALATRTGPWADRMRFNEFLHFPEPPTPERTEWLINYHRDHFEDHGSPIGWLSIARTLSFRLDQRLYLIEAEDRALPQVAAYIARDPYDYRRLTSFIEYVQNTSLRDNPAWRARLRPMWLDAMVYGRLNPGLWGKGADIMASPWWDVEAAYPYYVNSVVTEESPAGTLGYALKSMLHVRQAIGYGAADNPAPGEPGKEEVLAFLDCAEARFARLMVAACKGNGEWYCRAGDSGMAAALKIDAELSRGRVCPELADATALDLAFTELMPVPEVEDHLAGIDLGITFK